MVLEQLFALVDLTILWEGDVVTKHVGKLKRATALNHLRKAGREGREGRGGGRVAGSVGGMGRGTVR